MENRVLALIASFIAMFCVSMAYFMRKKSYYLLCQLLCILFLSVSYFFTLQFFAMIGLAVGFFRAITFFIYENKEKQASIYWSFLFSVLTILSYWIINFKILKTAQPLDILCLSALINLNNIIRVKMSKIVSVLDFGARGDGFHDDYQAIQSALHSGATEVRIPIGTYNVSQTLTVPSNVKVVAEKCAHLLLRGGKRKKRRDFLLSNDDTVGGNENIEIVGGIWDGCCMDPENDKPDLFDTNGYSGAVLNFCGVKGLKLLDLSVKNSTTFFIRISRIQDFFIENIDFSSDEFAYNQDGIHFGGNVRSGVVRNIRALTRGQTNDDMIALNADDCIERVENLDLSRDVIEDITFENIYAENCYTVVRLLSVTAPIRNIVIKNVYAGYRNYVINADSARYCRTPLFQEEDYPDGVGCVSNFLMENVVVHPVCENVANKNVAALPDPTYAIRIECLCKNLIVKDFRFTNNNSNLYAFLATNVTNTDITVDGNKYYLKAKQDKVLSKNFNQLTVNSQSLKEKI